jgi:hypothetical protein
LGNFARTCSVSAAVGMFCAIVLKSQKSPVV